MNKPTVMKLSKDGMCSFDGETHSYFLGGKRLLGVTSYISKFKNHFDSDLIAERYAKKNGLDKLKVLAEWKEEGERSLKAGNACHSIIENYINTGKIEEYGISPKEKVSVKIIEDLFLTERLIPVEAECIVYNDFLASQIDCVCRNKEGDIFILDWKTNKKISKDSYGKYMLDTYSYLPDSTYYHYSLQLKIYEKLYPVKGSYIVHIEDESYSLIKPYGGITFDF
jgi:ATP-dependent exoDNAse (exonuclease V) beta subunit